MVLLWVLVFSDVQPFVMLIFASLLHVAFLLQLRIEYTCATNTNNVRVVFETCKEAILRANVKGSGFMTT